MNQNHLFKYINYPLPYDIKTAKEHGYFNICNDLIDKNIKETSNDDLKNALLLQKEIIKRLPEEFPYTIDEVLSIIKEYISDFKDEEFDNYDIDYIYIDDVKHYFNRFLEVMLNSYHELQDRLIKSHPLVIHNNEENILLENTMNIIKSNKYLSKRITIRNTLKIKDEYFKGGKVIVHIPIPKPSAYISDINIDKTYPLNYHIDSENSHQRTITFIEDMNTNHEFIVEYSFTNTIKYIDFDKLLADKIYLKYPPSNFNLNEEYPHIVFSDKLKELSSTIVRDIKDPLLKVKAIYDYITLNFTYSFMPSYFVLDNILDNTIIKSKGDCGIKSLLFITLCRYNGIPAIWQSGYTSEDNFCGGHDWAAFYLEPYGYIYTDVSYGVDAQRFNSEARRKFYMTNIDPYRMLANDQFYADFEIDKKYFRDDPYDNQLGEIEDINHGLDFNEYTRLKEVISIKDISTR